MFHDSTGNFQGMVGLHQNLDRRPYTVLAEALGGEITFASHSQLRKRSREQADKIEFDKTSLGQVSIDCNRNLEIAAKIQRADLSRVMPMSGVIPVWAWLRWRSDVHLELLPRSDVSGYLLRLSRRLYPPERLRNKSLEIGEVGHLFIAITPKSFDDMPRYRKRPPSVLRHPNLMAYLVQKYSELLFLFDGDMVFVAGMFYNGKLIKTRNPNQTRDGERGLEKAIKEKVTDVFSQ